MIFSLVCDKWQELEDLKTAPIPQISISAWRSLKKSFIMINPNVIKVSVSFLCRTNLSWTKKRYKSHLKCKRIIWIHFFPLHTAFGNLKTFFVVVVFNWLRFIRILNSRTLIQCAQVKNTLNSLYRLQQSILGYCIAQDHLKINYSRCQRLLAQTMGTAWSAGQELIKPLIILS